ncbi:fimbria/pilus periplasmic chaperone [Pseudocitrobacter cyperus]|uniref:Fimbria/pilus periplasmic chaperone n=1 Tax=Pseudocitrobacter cyperus TaxID=3112843 RepID=A0ABV0HLF1_9ENTR
MMKRIVICGLLAAATTAHAAITPDRTRLIFNGEEKSISVTLKNDNSKKPYLAQAWVEDVNGNKINSPLTVLPPVQRIESLSSGQVKVQGMPGLASLPQDRETLFYFNVREIPPKSSKPNTLQIALQTRIKLFYRPAAISKVDMLHPWQNKVTLVKEGSRYKVVNPTAWYVVIGGASPTVSGKSIEKFTALVLAPNSSQMMNIDASELGSSPVLTYVNDYGGRLPLVFRCSGTTCVVDEAKSGKS